MSNAPRAQLAEELLRRLAAAIRAAQLYSANHPIVSRNLDALMTALQPLHAIEATAVIGLVGGKLIVDDAPVAGAETFDSVIRRLKRLGIERITLDRGATTDELSALVFAITSNETGGDAAIALPALPHVRVGRVTVEQRIGRDTRHAGTMRELYNEAVTAAETVYESARSESKPDATVAKTLVDGLAQAVAQNRTALLALTTLKNYDNYTFTHMVNVSILTMGQARGLGIDGPMLREFGLAGLMHDIGKVRTPLDVLNKPDKLTDTEFAIMKRHTIDGAEILRQTPDMPALAPIVAFEHHLRLDHSGYPDGVRRELLNLGTMLCSIGDVYDAMRSQRTYQQSFPSERVVQVLKRNDGTQFDQHLVRRFVQLIGIYPVGNLVKLDTDEIGVVTRINAPDPFKPQVRVLFDRAGARLNVPYDVNLWEHEPGGEFASSVVAPVDPANYDFDPLTLI